MTDSILRTVRDRLEAAGALRGVAPDRITAGERTILVELTAPTRSESAPFGSEGVEDEADSRALELAGLAHRPRGGDRLRSSDAPTVTLEELLEPLDGSGSGGPGATESLARAVATLNALSTPFLEWRDGDPMALLEPSVETIATVGLFRPAFRKFDDVDVRVIERTDVGAVSTPPGVRLSTFDPDDAERAMAGAAVVFVTGSAFVYGGASRYLELAPASATVVVAGADVVAGSAVDDPRRVREAIRDDACGTDLHDSGVRKVYAATDHPSGLRLDLGTGANSTPIDR
ncbi:DUF364 domain-containing protein [Natrarchaeobius sp. A-rgal3]|uniref:Rossmann-like domain-containing protein n=1 Tax=Natrarchaeobius versutus TaxID=1679078 RepID=UPI00350F946D